MIFGGGGIPIGPDDMNKENIGVLDGTPLFKTLDEDYETRMRGLMYRMRYISKIQVEVQK